MNENAAKNSTGEIAIYRDSHGPELKISIRDQSIWLTQAQIAQLFEVQRPAITKHIKNVLSDGELREKSVCSILELTAEDGKTYRTMLYNLDMVISVGYRVNSKKATQFRIWATEKLRSYLVDGYVLNEKRLAENRELKLRELELAHRVIQTALESRRLEGYEKDLLRIITDYANTWFVLNGYDKNTLGTTSLTKKPAQPLGYAQISKAIARFKARLMEKHEASELFGKENEGRLSGVLGSIHQTHQGADLYSSIEEKASHLFYFAIKDHPFVDGNKRIASLLLILFMVENHCLYNRKGERRVNDSALAALAILVAESKPEQKEILVQLVVNLIGKR